MSEPRNRVVQVRRFGGPEGLELVAAPMPEAGRGEVRVRVIASGLEYTDVVIRRHLYPQTMRRRPPFVLGYDVVGEIDQIGEGVRGFRLGERVADMTVLGSNAAYRTLRADDVTHVPAGVDAAEAAALILSWTTAYQLLHRAARVRCGQRVLVHGAAGAVGQALLVLGKRAAWRFGAPHEAGTRRCCASWGPRRLTMNAKISCGFLPTGSMSFLMASARTATPARSKRSSGAGCSASLDIPRECSRSVARPVY